MGFFTDRHPVVSSNLKSVGWTPYYGFNLLEVEFHGGRVYVYTFVPESVYDGLMVAPSKGKYFHQHIKKGTPYAYDRLN